MMKKSLARVKQQLADQLRPGKTDALSEELQAADKRVEYLREILQSLTKVLPLPSNGDKRLKKGPDYNIFSALKNEKLINNEDGYGELVQPIFTKYCEMFYNLSEEYVSYEMEVDKNVAIPIHKLLETDIIKLKKNLNKYVSDRDTANNRLQTAQHRHSELPYKHHTDPSKLSSLQEDVEEAGQKVEQASDQLAHDMFTLLAKEPEISNYILLHIKLRRQYYENALDVLNRVIPDIEHLINNSEVRPVFNCPLADHLRVTKRKIALPIELCVCAILEHGIAEEGLFRVAGGASKLRRLKLSIDANCLTLPLPVEYKDIHLFAGVLKSYLRELPEPLLTLAFHDDWIHAGRITNDEKRITAIKEILANLPTENYDNLKYLIKFLSELSKNPQNKMSSHNIAIVMSPNLLWSRQDPDLDELGYTSRAVDTLVSFADLFFPGETNFYLTYKRGEIFRPDLTKSSHVRNNSNDTNTIILDHEANYSENSSPKPVARRKNKPAPDPPKTSDVTTIDTKVEKPIRQNIVSGTATVNRTTYKNDKIIEIDKKTGETTEDVITRMRRKSLDIDREVPKISPVKKEHPHFNKEDIGEPTLISNTVTTPVKDLIDPIAPVKSEISSPVQNVNVTKITAQNVTVGKIIGTQEPVVQKPHLALVRPITRPPPVAAPRLSLADQKQMTTNSDEEKIMTKSLNDIDLSETVELRRSKDEILHDRGNKPMIPERPASLRPASFRLPRSTIQPLETTNHEAPPGGVAASYMLERTVMYNVPDKQQVAFVQFKDREKMPSGHDTQIAEKEKFLGHQPSSLVVLPPPPPPAASQNINSSNRTEKETDTESSNNCDDELTTPSSTNSLQRRCSIGAKPVRPPKPDLAKSTERLHLITKSNERLNYNERLSNNNNNSNATSIEINNSTNDTTKPSHARTMSEGNIVDSPPLMESPSSPLGCAINNRPPSPRGPSRPPRPQPPPPPPPVTNKTRSSTESTDL